MEKTYLFYDIETTGLNPAFDQVIQFAAIRTDIQLNEIERIELQVKLRPDILPSPEACLVHELTPQQMQEGLCEFEAIQIIHRWFNQPGTISLGYNTLGFDDEFLRFSFYRNLLTPYTHQYNNQCSRMDIYPIIVFYYLFCNSALNWTIKEGKPSFRLEHINESNQLADGKAHNAMSDVEATLALARKLFAYGEQWKYCVGYFQKEEELKRWQNMESAFTNRMDIWEGIYIDGLMGSNLNFMAPVISLGQHRHYKNQFIFLRLDTENITDSHQNEIQKTTWALRKKLCEPGFILPARGRFLEKLNKEKWELANKNKAWLAENIAILQKIIDYHLDYKYPEVDNVDVDSALYMQGFMTADDIAICQQFHTVSIEKKIDIVQRFSKDYLKELALRIIARNYQEDAELKPAKDHKGQQKLTKQLALEKISELEERDLTEEKKKILTSYKNFISN